MTDTTTAPKVWLSRGSHEPGGEYCLLEHISIRAGEDWSDRPDSVHPVLAAVGRAVNDRLGDEDRQQLVAFEDRMMGTARPGDKPLAVRLAIWCARQVLHLVREQDRAVCEAAIRAAEAWCEDPSAAAADAAADAADAAYADAAYAATDAAYAAYAAYDAAAVRFLDGLISEYERLTTPGGGAATRGEAAAANTEGTPA